MLASNSSWSTEMLSLSLEHLTPITTVPENYLDDESDFDDDSDFVPDLKSEGDVAIAV